MLGQRIATMASVRQPVARTLRGSRLLRERMEAWEQSPRCVMCGRVVTFHEFELDHIIPLSEGGTDARTNLQVACHECHLAKSEREARRRSGWRG